MNEGRGVTFISATHEQLVMDHARRLVRLHDGRIVSDELQR
jgi:putative ABC transport system ATP-binding protein